MPDEMPTNRDGNGVHLWQRLLNPVLSDVSKARIPGRLNCVGPVSLGDGDNRYKLAMTAAAPSRLDASADLSKPVREV